MEIQPFFDKDTATITYVVSDAATKACVIIDSVLDYDPASGRTSTKSADRVMSYVKEHGLKVEWILETHIHADHLTAASYLKENLGGKIAISETIIEALKYWVPIFGTANDTPLDGTQFDKLWKDGETFSFGNLKAEVFFTPGHTPVCACYHIGDAVFVGDTIFMPTVGTARADFPGGNAQTLYRSIQKILSLPDATRLFMCHDYPQEGNTPAFETTVGVEKKKNIFINEKVSEADYVQKRRARDAGLGAPRLLLPSLQVNLRAGKLGNKEKNGKQYIKIPLNTI
jgi:glyoxylase-like metal-dependent hydrolase (beta-lactamase superfamily II)